MTNCVQRISLSVIYIIPKTDLCSVLRTNSLGSSVMPIFCSSFLNVLLNYRKDDYTYRISPNPDVEVFILPSSCIIVT